VGLERGPLNFVSTIVELFEGKSSGSGLESRECGRRDPLSAKFNTNFADKRRSLGRYSSLADSGHGVFLRVFQNRDQFRSLLNSVINFRVELIVNESTLH
jgi:hypothetical protein